MTGIEPRQSDVELPTHRVRVLEWGPEDGPLIVALHGFPDTAWTWRRVALLLSRGGYRVAAPFMRGYAPSGIPSDGDYSVRALASDAVALHTALKGDERTALVGHDWGAITAAALAADPANPYGPVASLAVPPLSLVSPGRGSVRPWLSAMSRQPFRSWYVGFNQVPGLAESSFDWLAARLWRKWSPGYDAARDLARLAEAVPSRAHARAVLSYYRALRGAGARAALQPPLTPLLYLHGDQDGCLDPRLFPLVAARLPEGSASALLRHAGHFLHLEHPDVVARHLLDFLREPGTA